MRRNRYVLTEEVCRRIEIADPGLGRRDLTAYLERELSLVYPGRISSLKWDYRKDRGRLYVYYMEAGTFAQLKGTPGTSYAFYYEGDGVRIFRDREKRAKATKAAAGVTIFLLATFVFFVFPLRRNRGLRQELRDIKIEAEEEKARYAEELEKSRRLDEVKRKLSILQNAEPPDLYERLSLFYPYFSGSDYISNITIQDNEFQSHAYSREPLELLERIREDESLSWADMESTDVDPHSSMESFLWKGGFRE